MEEEEKQELKEPAKRLCSEIQLFDLCELESCSYKTGTFCGNSDLLERFERIAEDERPVNQYMDEDPGEFDEDDELFFANESGEDEYADEGWEE